MPLKEVRTHHYVLFHEENILGAGLIAFPQSVQNVPSAAEHFGVWIRLEDLGRGQIGIPNIFDITQRAGPVQIDPNVQIICFGCLRYPEQTQGQEFRPLQCRHYDDALLALCHVRPPLVLL